MSSHQSSKEIRARLGHPVIDCDRHYISSAPRSLTTSRRWLDRASPIPSSRRTIKARTTARRISLSSRRGTSSYLRTLRPRPRPRAVRDGADSFEFILLRTSVSRVSDIAENRTKSARVRAICDRRRTRRTPLPARFAVCSKRVRETSGIAPPEPLNLAAPNYHAEKKSNPDVTPKQLLCVQVGSMMRGGRSFSRFSPLGLLILVMQVLVTLLRETPDDHCGTSSAR